MRRGWVLALLALASGVVSVALAVAVNVATGGVLPPALRPLAVWAWPAVGAGAVAAAGLALWQQRLQLPAAPSTAVATDPAPRLTPAQLPPEVADFTGREADEAALRAAIAGGARVVAIAGPPGVGKSTLANRLAHLLRAAYPDGQLYVNLGAGRGDPMSTDEALARFLATLGDAEPAPYGDTEALTARYRTLVADRRLLVVLDDAQDADQVRPLLPAGPRCAAIVTSRPLPADLPEAVAFELAPLATADAWCCWPASADRTAARPTRRPPRRWSGPAVGCRWRSGWRARAPPGPGWRWPTSPGGWRTNGPGWTNSTSAPGPSAPRSAPPTRTWPRGTAACCVGSAPSRAGSSP
ncbi:ATP-binding protein [Actinacidiphila glaucinigra]|uniref:ATP-binding protein n=1 Tax=Actinacidiphila glaucinigra TaxID=235986 RepID=UPI001FEA9077|nr:ATP-binding protein [Actinacidiphila glaucinigra]